MKTFFETIPQNVFRIFTGRNLVWQVVAIFLTMVFVVMGLDWIVYEFFFKSFIYGWFFPGAGFLGFILPLTIPLSLLLIGHMRKDTVIERKAWTIAQAALLGLLVSFFYKALTGRPGPELGEIISGENISQVFRFGFLRGGVFWGWPSSHTTVAFSVATAMSILYKDNKIIPVISFLTAAYIGFGAAISFHWFSDGIAGLIFGTIVGSVVGKTFWEKKLKDAYNKE